MTVASLTSLPQQSVDMEPGTFVLPTMRVVTAEGYGEAVPLDEMTSQQRVDLRGALLRYRREVACAVQTAIEDLEDAGKAARAAADATSWEVARLRPITGAVRLPSNDAFGPEASR